MSAPTELPDVVRRALDLSRRKGFVTSSRVETGRLLATLAASRTGTLGECGTGCGVGAAWLASGARRATRIVTAELDAALAGAVADLFAGVASVEVIPGDWTALRDRAPFSLLFLDVPGAKQSGVDAVADLLEPGGIVVLDDFTPSPCWPPLYDGRVDAIRLEWLTDPRFTTVEVMVTEDTSVLVAAKR